MVVRFSCFGDIHMFPESFSKTEITQYFCRKAGEQASEVLCIYNLKSYQSAKGIILLNFVFLKLCEKADKVSVTLVLGSSVKPTQNQFSTYGQGFLVCFVQGHIKTIPRAFQSACKTTPKVSRAQFYNVQALEPTLHIISGRIHLFIQTRRYHTRHPQKVSILYECRNRQQVMTSVPFFGDTF